MSNIQTELFNELEIDVIKAVEKEKKAEVKRRKIELKNRSPKPPTAEAEFKFTFLVNSSHIQRWRDCDIKTA